MLGRSALPTTSWLPVASECPTLHNLSSSRYRYPTRATKFLPLRFATARLLGFLAHARIIRMPKKRPPTPAPLLPNITPFPASFGPLGNFLSNRYSYHEPIGQGDNGTTHRVSPHTQPALSLCLKIPHLGIAAGDRLPTLKAAIRQEATILSGLRHRCLPYIIEYGTESSVPFYICNYHPGRTLTECLASGIRLDLANSRLALSDLLHVIAYVHKSGHTHCDLHPKNIMISSDIAQDGVLVLDFGHTASETGKERVQHSRHPTTAGKNSSDREQHDLRALGRLLRDAEPIFIATAPPLVQGEYRRLTADLISSRVRSSSDSLDRLDLVFNPLRNCSNNEDLFYTQGAQRESIVIPVAEHVPVGRPSLAVINTAEFQRLRSLKQLSFCDWRFPGATHTRFEHALGVFALSIEVMQHLTYDPSFRASFGPIESRAFLLSALVHDIGHYPFAHAVEQYAATVSQHTPGSRLTDIAHHEHFTKELIETNGEFRRTIVNHWGAESATHSVNILSNRSGALSRLIDGPLDIDKMDYLARDAHHAGLAAGASYSPRLLCRTLVCTRDGKDICATMDELAAIEGFIVLQDQLYGALYWHEAVRAVHCMFQLLLSHLVADDPTRLADLVRRLRGSHSEEAAAQLQLIPMLQRRKSDLKAVDLEKLKGVASLIARPQYSGVYKTLKTYRHSDTPLVMPGLNIYRTILREPTQTGSLSQIDNRRRELLRNAYLEAILREHATATAVDILVDVPFGKGAKRLAYIMSNTDLPPTRIDELTHISSSAFESPVLFWSPVRVFVSPVCREAIGPKLDAVIAAAEAIYKERVASPE